MPAELVVPSACQTALGKELKGEGIVGLTRGFMYAGSRRVVSSLWKVDDFATAELMKRFYGGMWTGGHPAAAALREAKRRANAGCIAESRQFHWKRSNSCETHTMNLPGCVGSGTVTWSAVKQ